MESLETRIGYKFANSLLLAEALTHSSLAYETQRPHFDNQRLEYLGDAVLQLVLTERLFTMFPGFAEGRLTKLRSRLVSREALCQFARTMGLGDYLMLGRGEESTGGRERPSNLADAFEALLGAVYLDGGLEACTALVDRHCSDAIARIAEKPVEKNPKGQLQELLQGIVAEAPSYKITDLGGPDHCKVFEALVEWQDMELARGRGASKKEAEIAAAALALEERRWEKLSKGGE